MYRRQYFMISLIPLFLIDNTKVRLLFEIYKYF